MLSANAINADMSSDGKTWYVLVQDASFHLQVHIRLSGEKLLDYSCNCKNFQADGLCSHVVSGILYVRQQSSNATRELPKIRQSKSRELPRVKNLVANIPEEQLGNFILDYSKKDELFRLLFYARFIDQIDSGQISDFIDKIFPVIKSQQAKVPAKQIRQFIVVSRELMSQVQMYFSQQDLLKAFQIIFLLLKKSFYIHHYIGDAKSNFEQNHLELIRNYNEVFQSIEAPEFKERAHEMQLNLLESSFIKVEISEERKLWAPFIKSQTYVKRIQDIVSRQLSEGAQKSMSTKYFLTVLDLLTSDDGEINQKLLNQSYQSIYRLIHILIDNPFLGNTIDILKKIYLTYPLKHQLAITVLKAIPPDDYDEAFFDKNVALFEETNDLRFLEHCQKDRQRWDNQLGKIELRLNDLTNRQPLIRFYLFTEEVEKAKDSLLQSLDIVLLEKLDVQFASRDSRFIYKAYEMLTREYLSHHFGLKTLSFVDRIKRRIREWGGDKLLRQYNQFLQEEFSSREYLTP